MFFLIFGSRGASDVFGVIETRFCEVCERDRDFYITRTYRYGHLFWVPLFSWGTEVIFHCNICNRGYVLTENQAKPYLDMNPKPWFHRFGWVIPFAIVLLIYVIPI